MLGFGPFLLVSGRLPFIVLPYISFMYTDIVDYYIYIYIFYFGYMNKSMLLLLLNVVCINIYVYDRYLLCIGDEILNFFFVKGKGVWI